MTRARIMLDESDESIVVTCSECRSWAEHVWTRAAALEAGHRHQQDVHRLAVGNAGKSLRYLRHAARQASDAGH